MSSNREEIFEKELHNREVGREDSIQKELNIREISQEVPNREVCVQESKSKEESLEKESFLKEVKKREEYPQKDINKK